MDRSGGELGAKMSVRSPWQFRTADIIFVTVTPIVHTIESTTLTYPPSFSTRIRRLCKMPQEIGGDLPTSGMENLHLDPVTGDRVSKSELKKRIKQREQEEKKQKKAAQAPPRPEKKTSTKYEEADLNPNVCEWPSRLGPG